MTMTMNFTKGSLVACLLALKDVSHEKDGGTDRAKSRLNLLTSCVFLYLLFLYLWCRSKSRQPWKEGRGKIVSPAAHKRPTDRTHNLCQTGVLFLDRCRSSWAGLALSKNKKWRRDALFSFCGQHENQNFESSFLSVMIDWRNNGCFSYLANILNDSTIHVWPTVQWRTKGRREEEGGDLNIYGVPASCTMGPSTGYLLSDRADSL